MKIHTFLIIFYLLLTSCLSCFGQDYDDIKMVAYPSGKHYMSRLYLTDKNGCNYELSHPESFLSEKSLARRDHQGLSVDSTDLPVSKAYLQQIKYEGVEIVTKSKWNNTVVVKSKSRQVLRKLSSLPFVKQSRIVWISPDSIPARRRQRLEVKSELNIWKGLPNSVYGATHEQVNLLSGDYLHNNGILGKGITIAVLDGGFMNIDRIPAFQDVLIAGTEDFVVPKSKSVYDEIDHGTKVLSVMAVSQPGIFRGTAPEASFWLLRCEDPETEQLVEEDYWVAAAEFADSVGVDILTTSLGYHHYDAKDMNYSYKDLDGRTALISNTASMLAGKGIVAVCSAGNDGMGSWKKINVPADADNIISVGAATSQKVNAGFSSIGPTADNRVKPDVLAMGAPASVITGRGTILKDSGTSFAAPQVAGMIACLWQAYPQLTASNIVEVVRMISSNHDTPDNIMGYGIPDFSQELKKAVTAITTK